MKLSNSQAAFCYLLYYNLEEADALPHQSELMEAVDETLIEGQWPGAADIVFDNDGEPIIEWPDDFDYEIWIRNPALNEETESHESFVKPWIEELMLMAMDSNHYPLRDILNHPNLDKGIISHEADAGPYGEIN